MANINTNPSGKVLTANGIVILNNVSNVDPRKAVVFDSRQDALDGIDNAQGYNRVENLILYYKENGKTVAGIFDGGISDENFIPFITDTSKWELLQENPYNLRLPTVDEINDEFNSYTGISFGKPLEEIFAVSPLKMPASGERGLDGTVYNEGIKNGFWTSNNFGENARYSGLRVETLSTGGNIAKARGFSVRLIVEGTFTQQQFDDNYANETVTINKLDYGFVYNPTTQCIWLDRNLGATQVATSITDSNAYGDLFQWGRPADGHEKRDSNTTTIQATTPQPENGDFFIDPSFTIRNWLTPDNENLWQGVQGINNPALLPEKLIGKNSKKASYNDLLDKPDFDELAGFDYIQTESGIGVFFNQQTGDVVNPVTGMLIFNVNNINRPTIYDGAQWNGLAYEDVQQNIIVGGNYHDLAVTGNILVFTNDNARAVITGFNTTKYKKLILSKTIYKLSIMENIGKIELRHLKIDYYGELKRSML